MAEKIEVMNVNHPGHRSNVDASKYAAMKVALLKVLPDQEPGLSQKEMMEAVKAHLPDDLFPGGAKSGWWVKTVQLDLEARKQMSRLETKPLTWIKG